VFVPVAVAVDVGVSVTVGVDVGDRVDEVYGDLTRGGAAVVVARESRPEAVLTRSDLLEYLAHHRADTVL